MNQAQKITILLTWVCILAAVGYGQSLGDVARQQRQERLAKDPNAAPKVITNDDMPSSAEVPASHKGRREDLSLHHQKTAGQWKAEIQGQENQIAALQNQIERVNASIHFARVPLSGWAAQRNERQLEKQENVKQMQAQLEELQQRLEDTQEAARKDGYGNSVYEP